MIVFEDPYARPTDPFITEGRAGTPVAFLGDEVYQLVEPDRAGDSLALPVGERPLIGVASRLAASSAALSHRAGMAPDVIEQFADNAPGGRKSLRIPQRFAAT